MRSDEQIKKDIVDQLYWDGRVDASRVLVEVSRGVVTLSGAVPTYRARQAAYEDAWFIAGVLDVANLISVETVSQTRGINDDSIAENIINILANNPDIEDSDIQVEVREGRVTLNGTVGSFWEKLQTEDVIANIGGVIDIQNDLAVVPARSISDEEIAKDIVAAFERSTRVNPEDITVTVDNGIVDLVGAVPDRRSYNAVCRIVSHTAGVIDIHDHLTMTYTGYPWNKT